MAASGFPGTRDWIRLINEHIHSFGQPSAATGIAVPLVERNEIVDLETFNSVKKAKIDEHLDVVVSTAVEAVGAEEVIHERVKDWIRPDVEQHEAKLYTELINLMALAIEHLTRRLEDRQN